MTTLATDCFSFIGKTLVFGAAWLTAYWAAHNAAGAYLYYKFKRAAGAPLHRLTASTYGTDTHGPCSRTKILNPRPSKGFWVIFALSVIVWGIAFILGAGIADEDWRSVFMIGNAAAAIGAIKSKGVGANA